VSGVSRSGQPPVRATVTNRFSSGETGNPPCCNLRPDPLRRLPKTRLAGRGLKHEGTRKIVALKQNLAYSSPGKLLFAGQNFYNHCLHHNHQRNGQHGSGWSRQFKANDQPQHAHQRVYPYRFAHDIGHQEMIF